MVDEIFPVPESELLYLRARLESCRYPDLTYLDGWQRGVDEHFFRELIEYWLDAYDWRQHESRILALPWETVACQEGILNIVHRCACPEAQAVVLLHGWPDSVLRFEKILPLLSDVAVVIPALPGFPFSHKLPASRTSVATMATLIGEAMAELGYSRYVVSGGDVGADVAECLATRFPDNVSALHLTNISPLHAVFADRQSLDAASLAYLSDVVLWQRSEGGYIAQQSTRPHTLAFALADSPAGLAAWIAEKLYYWSDIPFSKDDIITWVCAYWFTEKIGTSFIPYVDYERPADYVNTPTVISAFSNDIKPAPQSFIERFINVRAFRKHASGGHFAAWECPEEYVADLREALNLAL